MSYCRFSEGDVYVFTSSIGLECCGCSLIPRHWVERPGSFLGGYLAQDNPDDTEVYDSNEAMIAHLERHQAAGHDVPEDAFRRLRDPEDAAENQRIWAKYAHENRLVKEASTP